MFSTKNEILSKLQLLADDKEIPIENLKKLHNFEVNRENKYSPVTKETFTNEVTSTTVSWFSLVPYAIISQFFKVSNVYFLLLSVLQLLPSISNSGGEPVLLIPLLIVVFINSLKDMNEHYNKMKVDQIENGYSANVISPNAKANTPWRNILPGEVVKVRQNEFFPADLILLYSTNRNGVAFIETKNLDGETNLKSRKPITELYKHFRDSNSVEDAIRNVNGVCTVDVPNNNLYSLNGAMSLKQIDPSIKSDIVDTSIDSSMHIFNVELNNTLMRGSSLKNTDYIYGLVCYTGNDTKMMQNKVRTIPKSSHLTQIMRELLEYIVVFVLSFSALATVIHLIWRARTDPTMGGFSFISEFIPVCFTWILNISNVVPISLVVTIEICKFFQSFFIGWDVRMIERKQGFKVIVQNSVINEELGQITHIVTDKTGTLTKNQMKFKYLIAGGETYGSELSNKNEKNKEPNVDFNDPRLFEHWRGDHFNAQNIESLLKQQHGNGDVPLPHSNG